MPIAFGRNVADDEDSMSEMACCNMKTRKVERAQDVDRSVVVVGEEVRSVGRCGEFVVGILIGRRNRVLKIPTQTFERQLALLSQLLRPALARFHFPAGSLRKWLSNLHLLAAASVLVRNLT